MKLLEFIKKLLSDQDLLITICLFIIWRAAMFLVLILAVVYLPLSGKNFLGGGLENYLNNIYLFSWANFDGEHYLSIAQNGYQSLTHSFFPVYPALTKIVAFYSSNLSMLAISGLMISNISFVLCLFIFWKLIKLDYTEKIALYSTISLLLFPTSFYFGSLYTGSFFLLLTLISFYFARTNKWWLAGIFGAIASATRINGILILPALLIEWWQNSRKWQSFLPIWIVTLGILSYMFYLYQATGSPFTFYNELSVYGEQRQGNFVLLPQVFYRYFNMILTVDRNSLIYWTIVSEVVSAILIIVSLVSGYLQKMRWSYLLYFLLSFILPTLTGSFSSMPRYTLTIFPIFIIFGMFLSKRSVMFKTLIFTIMGILLIINGALFLRGYWVA